jgi:cell division protein ZapD
MARFEYPLNERSRILLRLEFIFSRILHYLPSEVTWDSQASISGLVEAANLFSRADLKSELLKELDRNIISMKRIGGLAGVDGERLQQTLGKLESSQQSLLQHKKQIGLDLREDDFFKTIMQRSAIPGGTCSFDLPQFHLWLSRSTPQRVATITKWFDEFRPMHDAVSLLLTIYRGSYISSGQLAENGFYQQSFDPLQSTQLLNIEIAAELSVFPEVSGNKHRVSIRFRQVDCDRMRISTYQENLEFQLGISII